MHERANARPEASLNVGAKKRVDRVAVHGGEGGKGSTGGNFDRVPETVGARLQLRWAEAKNEGRPDGGWGPLVAYMRPATSPPAADKCPISKIAAQICPSPPPAPSSSPALKSHRPSDKERPSFSKTQKRTLQDKSDLYAPRINQGWVF